MLTFGSTLLGKLSEAGIDITDADALEKAWNDTEFITPLAQESAAKAGILGLTKAMARECAPDNVRFNAICPGFIATDITAGKLTDEMRASVLAGIPMGRAGTADDVAGCALFLASDLSSYCTGTEVDVNGGSLIH